MSALTRRDFIRFIGAGGSLAVLGLNAGALAGQSRKTPAGVRVVVIGDTPRDIDCAHANGAPP